MAERLETIVNGVGQKQSIGFHAQGRTGLTETQHGRKSIGQLKREIIALRSDCDRKNATQAHGPSSISSLDDGRRESYHAQELLAKMRVLETKVTRYEHKISKRDDYIQQLKSEVSSLQQKMLDAAQDLRAAQVEKEKAIRRATESEEELGTLKSSFDRDISKINRLQEDLDRAEVLADQLESKKVKSDELYLLEKNRRIELEQKLVDTEEMKQSLKRKLDMLKSQMHAEHDDFHAELDALRKRHAEAQAEALQSKKYATEQAEQLIKVVNQRDDALKEISKVKKSLNESRAASELYLHRVQIAEEAAAAATAELHMLKINTESSASKSSKQTMHIETESKALKEVLKSVTASAQSKDEELVRSATLHEQEKSAWSGREAQYRAQVATLQEQVRVLEGDVVKERQNIELLKESLSRDNQEHLEALQELEAAHEAQFDSTVVELENRNKDLTARLNSQEEMAIIRDKEIEDLKEMQKAAEARAISAEERAAELGHQIESIKDELRQSQDEVETLLTARMNEELSRAAVKSSVHPDEQWLFSQELGELHDHPGNPAAKAHKETKKSPIKKLAAYMRRKTSPSKKQRQLNMESDLTHI